VHKEFEEQKHELALFEPAIKNLIAHAFVTEAIV
jgi:hypothetical protein